MKVYQRFVFEDTQQIILIDLSYCMIAKGFGASAMIQNLTMLSFADTTKTLMIQIIVNNDMKR